MKTEVVEEQGVQDDGREVTDEESTPDTPDEAPETERAGERGRAIDLVVLAIALIIFGAALVSWSKADDHDADAVARADLRDTVLITARSHIQAMNTLDYRDIDAGLKKWEALTTGTLKDQLVATDKETRQLMAEQEKISSGKVVDAAVVELTKDTATVIAMVEVTVRDGADASTEPTVKRNRFTADLAKVGGKWLLESLDQVAVNLS